MTKEEAEKILTPYFPHINESIQKGFMDYKDMITFDTFSKRRIIGFNARTKATMIQNLIIERIKETFADVKGVTVKDFKGVFGLHFKNQIFIRFNKFNSKLEPSRARTKQRIRFENQQTVIPGFPRKPLFLYAGYTFAPSLTGIGSIYISCRIKGKQEWIMEIFNSATINQTPIIFETKERLVKVKSNVKLKKAS